MLSTRVKSGGAELHKKYSDIFIVVSGEATEVTGGAIIDPKDSGDEIRGTRVDGGVAQVLRKGDVITIAPNTPHQTMVAPGQTFTYFVVKVAAPQQAQ
jgi:mannose-6-phosphate isomerase-like protein (cupin superfamily)